MALFSRIKNWVSGDTLLASDLNAEFDNLISNMIPQSVVSYSASVAQMRVQTDPGEQGTESLATSLAGELERIRFALTEIKGTTYWYESATSSISQLVSAIGTNLLANRISSGRSSSASSQPIFLVPSGAAATITLKGSVTPFVYSVRGTQYTISTDVTVTSLTTAPSTNNTATLNDSSLAAAFSKLVGENGTQITVNAMGSEITALNGKLAAFKTAGGEYFIARVESSTALTKAFRGYFFDSTDALVARGTLTNGNALTLMKLTWVYAKTDGTLAISYTNPRYTASAPTSASIGDYWFDMTSTVNYWKIYNGTSWIDSTSTLVGICIQDGTNCVGARSFDFFHNFDSENSCELMYEGVTEVRARYRGSKVSIYGTTQSWDQDWLRWNIATDLDSGVAEAASTYYYAYVKETGAPVLSDVAPYDMRGIRKGFYHPKEAWRCVGYVRNNASSDFQTDVESFFMTNEWRNVGSLTAAVANYPLPYNVTPRMRTILVDGTAGAINQVLPPAAQTKGEILRFIRTDATIANTITLTAFGADTLNGPGIGASATTVVMYTQFETYAMLSTGTAYYMLDHYATTSWTTWSPTVTGYGTPVSPAFTWRRVGDTGEYSGYLTTGTNTGVTVSISLPASHTMDATKFNKGATTANPGQSIGKWVINTVQSEGHIVMNTGTSSTLVYMGGLGSGANMATPQVGTIWSNGAQMFYWWRVPILGWNP